VLHTRNQIEDGMLNPRAVSMALAVALVGSLPGTLEAGTKKRTNIIKILEATYGGNCAGVEKGNATQFVAAACTDNDLCNYRVYYKQLGGDPAPECEKDFKVTYTCGRSPKASTCELPAEAGKGGEDGYPNQFCLLHCLSTAEPAFNGNQKAATKPVAAKSNETNLTAPPQQPMFTGSRPASRYSEERLHSGSQPFSGFWR
jgi:hypothetical protein